MAPGQTFQTYGFQTSVDLLAHSAVPSATGSSTKRMGVNRVHQGVDNDIQKGGINPVISDAVSTSLDGELVPRNWSTDSLRGPIPHSDSTSDFIRASSISQKKRITPSEIQIVSDQCSSLLEGVQHHPQYPQLHEVKSTTSSTIQSPLLSLDHPKYGLSKALIANFASLGIHSIYPWQASCLLGRGHLTSEKNLLYSAPTGGGKSLVADILMLKRVIEHPNRKAILVLPYVALVQEKLKWLRRIVQHVEKDIVEDGCSVGLSPSRLSNKNIRVSGFHGGSKSRSTWEDTDIAVCTIEKANALVNAAIEECTIGELGIVVVDEIHMLDDESRGYLLELLLTKLLLLQQDIQIVGMSATLSNTQAVAEWLDANYYISNHRPVPVEEFLVFDGAIYPAANSKEFFSTASKLKTSTAVNSSLLPHRKILPSAFRELANPTANAMISLTYETAAAGYGVLVFCGSRQSCQTNALLISEVMPDTSTVDPQIVEKRHDLIAELRSLPCGLDPVFQATIMSGVAFHHAGLTVEERELVADAYDRGILKVIVATCSLAAGVNLPARRVIMQGARMGRELVGPALLRQMRGRAGRKGKDIMGETYLICQKADLEAVSDIWEADAPAIESCLTPEKRGIKRALLEAIATRLASGQEAINEYISYTLLSRSADKEELRNLTDTTLEELLKEDLIRHRDEDNESFEPTKLGQAIVGSAFSPEDGLFVYEELRKASQAFVMDGEMHVFYLFTPLQVALNANINWSAFLDQIDELDESGLRMLELIGVQPGFVNKMVQTGGSIKQRNPEQAKLARIYHRAYTAFQLRDLSNEIPLSTIAERYHTPRGMVQNLAQTCHGFAAGMVKFCQRMGWGMLAVVLDHMRDRLQAGARDDLLEMAQVTFVKSWTARLLWENGFKSVRALAEADPKNLVPVLMMMRSRKHSDKDFRQDSSKEVERYTKKLFTKAEIIVASANKLWERQIQAEIEDFE